MTPPDRFKFTPIDWDLPDACGNYFWLQPTADGLNAAMDEAVQALARKVEVRQVVIDLQARAAALHPQGAALHRPTRDMALSLISRISGTDQPTLLAYWLGAKGTP